MRLDYIINNMLKDITYASMNLEINRINNSKTLKNHQSTYIDKK